MDSITHEVFNQYDELTGYDLFATDAALADAVHSAGAGWAREGLAVYGRGIGSPDRFRQAAEANRHLPELQAFDARGRRVDRVDFHPSWHALMAELRATGWLSLPFTDTRPGRWSASLAGMYLHAQVESGTTCPSTMTWAAIPLLQREPELWAGLGSRLCGTVYDARDLPPEQKTSIYVGMGMTEKQGGSDVRANTTRAVPIGVGGRGQAYAIRGHKWFFSAPMCDAHLVVARTEAGGPSCFFVPRWRPDGSRNTVQIQRLKDKVGNKSNASAEVEFLDAYGVLIGEEGRGIPTIIEMANLTRLACVNSSAAFIRQALVQALAYARQRQAFGRALADQPLMQAVLADLAIESEAALLLSMRLARAFECDDDPAERAWKRLVTPAAKFWVCKRAVELCGEAMEVFGGNGYVETGAMARLYREAPVNSIWEGSGNVMCLDLMRAIGRDPGDLLGLLDSCGEGLALDEAVSEEIAALRGMAAELPGPAEGLGRMLAQRLVLVLQAVLLSRHAPDFVADAFIATRFRQPAWGRVAGALDPGSVDADALFERAFPS